MSSQRPTKNQDSTDDSDPSETVGQFDPSKYATTHGAVPRHIDVGGEEHALRASLGESEHRSFQYDPRITGQRFADRYDDVSASIREYVANSETACIRRARKEILDATDEYTSDEIAEMGSHDVLELADDVAGYRPIIEVYHAHPESDLPDLVIADNGVGISIEEFQVLQRVGLSASHDDGSVLGQYGQGVMSGFLLAGEYGEFDMVTKSMNDESSYRERVRIDGFNDLPGTRDAYGTTWTFPSFCETAQEMDVQEAIEDFTSGLRVPVLFREFDHKGQEAENEDYPPTSLREAFDDDQPLIVYEDDAVEAVASPQVNTFGRSPKTFLVSMPINRNESISGSYAHESPWQFDLRLKYEDGRVYECNCEDDDHTGLAPIERGAYEHLAEDRKKKYIPKGDVGEDDILMPVPVDDRDRLKDGFSDFYVRISEKIRDEFKRQVAEILEILIDDGFEAVFELDMSDRSIFLSGYTKYGPRVRKPSVKSVHEALHEAFGVDIPDALAKKLGYVKEKVHHAPRGTSAPHLKYSQNEEPIWKVLSSVGEDDVYMGVTLNDSKCQLAWALGEQNQVVAVEKQSDYELYSKVFGWKLLKELSLYNISEEYPDLDDDIVDRLERTRGSSSNTSNGSGSGNKKTSYKAETRPIYVRRSTGSRGRTRMISKDVYEAFDEGNEVSISYRYDANELLVLRETDGNTASSYDRYCRNGIARSVVPNYVADYLLDADHTYASIDELREMHESRELTTYDITPYITTEEVEVEPEAVDEQTTLDDVDDQEDVDDEPTTRIDVTTARFDGSSGVVAPDAPTPTETTLGEIGSNTVIVGMSESAAEAFNDSFEDDELVDNRFTALLDALIEDNPVIRILVSKDEITSIAVVSHDTLRQSYLALANSVDKYSDEFDMPEDTPHVVSTMSTTSGGALSEERWTIYDGELMLDHELPRGQFPRDSPEWDLLENGAEIDFRNYSEDAQHLVATLKQLRELADSQDTPVLASAGVDEDDQDSSSDE